MIPPICDPEKPLQLGAGEERETPHLVGPVSKPTPPERSMIARRRWFSYRAPEIPRSEDVWRRSAKGSITRTGEMVENPSMGREAGLAQSLCRLPNILVGSQFQRSGFRVYLNERRWRSRSQRIERLTDRPNP